MVKSPIQSNFEEFKDLIELCFLEKDIIFYMVPLRELFSDEVRKFINESIGYEKVGNFIKSFNELENDSKYSCLKDAVLEKNRNQWIYTFLTVDINDKSACSTLRNKWKVFQNTLKLLEGYIDKIYFDEEFVHYLYSKEVISTAHKEFLLQTIKHSGPSTAIRELFNVISMKDLNWYGHLLYIIQKQNCNFFPKFVDLEPMQNYTENEKLQKCIEIANKYIQENIEIIENQTFNNDADISDYWIECDEIIDEFDSVEKDDVTMSTLEKDSATYEFKKFQYELCEKAKKKMNVIIYAPTGSGKTNIAVHIANHHLQNNSSGKVAFLVHRIPLVIQQFRVFQKFKNPEFNVVSIRGKSEHNCGPLISNLKDNHIFVMTSDILLNALTIDDGNKISSISEFSLIFFDECHNCLNSHPYTRVMKQYFKAKKEGKELPQIIGLTASPKSYKKEDLKGSTEKLFQLCASLDCFEISKVTENKEELEGFIARPEQKPYLTENRVFDDFQNALLKQIENCEEKFLKMKNEKYFPAEIVREIPINKFHESYANFIGNLKNLNIWTVDENDGKQKAYSIFRFLNAFYRGLIVNQMFDKTYAKESIEIHLKHKGVNFTCCFDEEFYKDYKDKILDQDYEQSDNLAISEICSQIDQQFQIIDSRVLIFVREIDFTYYLVDILTKSTEYTAEAIVGSSAKTELKVDTDDQVLSRFDNGTTKILVATTVVEEGLDVARCNMVISYGHVTNETSLVQRMGRLRASNSKYILVLPPMLHWLESKEKLNEHRRKMMMKSIEEFENGDRNERNLKIEDFQCQYYNDIERKMNISVNNELWKFTCKSCQIYICSTDDIRILENCHRVCIAPELLNKFVILEDENKFFGAQKSYKYAGKVLCFKCKNHQLGSYVYYRNNPFLQLKIDCCNATDSNGMKYFKSWKNFENEFILKDLSSAELNYYCSKLNEMEGINAI